MAQHRTNLIIIPVFNEERFLAGVVSEIRKYTYDNTDILVVNDGSTDASPNAISSLEDILAIHHKENLGYGKSIIDGFNLAIENGYTNVITIDCDWQHEPHLIREFFKETDDYDIVSGSRYLRPSREAPPEDRSRINRLITERINVHTGYSITDAFCGFKAYRVDGLRKLRLTEPRYGMPLQFWIQAAKNGLTVKEIPVGLVYFQWRRGFTGRLSNTEERLAYYNRVIDEELTFGNGKGNEALPAP